MKYLLITFLFAICLEAEAQLDSITKYSVPNPKSPTCIYLKPIQKIYGRYYYGDKLLSDIYSLEVPFYELNDPIVLQNYNRFKIMRGVGKYIQIIPSLYLLNIFYNQSRKNMPYFSSHSYWNVFIATEVLTIATRIAGNIFVKKAMKSYNQAITNPYNKNIGYWKIEGSDYNLGMAVKYKF